MRAELSRWRPRFRETGGGGCVQGQGRGRGHRARRSGRGRGRAPGFSLSPCHHCLFQIHRQAHHFPPLACTLPPETVCLGTTVLQARSRQREGKASRWVDAVTRRLRTHDGKRRWTSGWRLAGAVWGTATDKRTRRGALPSCSTANVWPWRTLLAPSPGEGGGPRGRLPPSHCAQTLG